MLRSVIRDTSPLSVVEPHGGARNLPSLTSQSRGMLSTEGGPHEQQSDSEQRQAGACDERRGRFLGKFQRGRE